MSMPPSLPPARLQDVQPHHARGTARPAGRVVEEYKKRIPDLAHAMAEEMGAPLSFASTAQVGAGIGGFMGTIAALQNFQFVEDNGAFKVAMNRSASSA
jgi:GTP cyclohydrolase FolE2